MRSTSVLHSKYVPDSQLIILYMSAMCSTYACGELDITRCSSNFGLNFKYLQSINICSSLIEQSHLNWMGLDEKQLFIQKQKLIKRQKKRTYILRSNTSKVGTMMAFI